MRYDKPCLKEDWHNAFLMADKHEHVVIDGIEMTAKNIWEYSGDREQLLEKIVDYFYARRSSMFSNAGTKHASTGARVLAKLKSADASMVLCQDGSTLKNTSNIGLDFCRKWCSLAFYSTHVNGTPSIVDVFNNRDLLRRVLKNRMGWYTTTEKLVLEDGTEATGEHPYLFDISDWMVIKGAHSSMVSANTSNFRPLVAKFLMQKFCRAGGLVLDLSAGWGARMLAAMSLGLDYYGIDPTTGSILASMPSTIDKKLSTSCTAIDGVSEDIASYSKMPKKADYCIVCPPYFKLEEYPSSSSSTVSYPDYNDWLEMYWRQTMKNAHASMLPGAKLSLIVVDKWGKMELLEDMSTIAQQEGFIKIDEMQYKTNRSHLTDKRQSRNMSKSTEKVYTFECAASKR